MISKGKELSEIKVDIANIKYEIDDNNSVGTLKLICREIAIKKGLLTLIKNA